MTHIFVSYSHDDSQYAHRLEDEFKRRGFEVWIDDRIGYGTTAPNVIEEHLDACAALVVIMTPSSKLSNWVQNELARAQDKRKPIFPLLLKGNNWLAVQATQHVDVRNGKLPPESLYAQLAQVVSPPNNALVASRQFEPEMVLIPAGEFLAGIDPEITRCRLHLPDYHISRTPITNRLYRYFVQEAGHKPPDYWQGDEPPKDRLCYPVVQVTWYDATDYCQWLENVTSRPYRLPSEMEWEKAARGTDGRVYPWGNEWDAERCNSMERAPRKERMPHQEEKQRIVATPVEQYSPRGDSPYGLADMAGNVWTWTQNLWGRDGQPEHHYPPGRKIDPDQPEGPDYWRVLRGGSFHNPRDEVRCHHRCSSRPDQASSDIGFRVVH